jgi:hypothetical protein
MADIQNLFSYIDLSRDSVSAKATSAKNAQNTDLSKGYLVHKVFEPHDEEYLQQCTFYGEDRIYRIAKGTETWYDADGIAFSPVTNTIYRTSTVGATTTAEAIGIETTDVTLEATKFTQNSVFYELYDGLSQDKDQIKVFKNISDTDSLYSLPPSKPIYLYNIAFMRYRLSKTDLTGRLSYDITASQTTLTADIAFASVTANSMLAIGDEDAWITGVTDGGTFITATVTRGYNSTLASTHTTSEVCVPATYFNTATYYKQGEGGIAGIPHNPDTSSLLIYEPDYIGRPLSISTNKQEEDILDVAIFNTLQGYVSTTGEIDLFNVIDQDAIRFKNIERVSNYTYHRNYLSSANEVYFADNSALTYINQNNVIDSSIIKQIVVGRYLMNYKTAFPLPSYTWDYYIDFLLYEGTTYTQNIDIDMSNFVLPYSAVTPVSYTTLNTYANHPITYAGYRSTTASRMWFIPYNLTPLSGTYTETLSVTENAISEGYYMYAVSLLRETIYGFDIETNHVVESPIRYVSPDSPSYFKVRVKYQDYTGATVTNDYLEGYDKVKLWRKLSVSAQGDGTFYEVYEFTLASLTSDEYEYDPETGTDRTRYLVYEDIDSVPVLPYEIKGEPPSTAKYIWTHKDKLWYTDYEDDTKIYFSDTGEADYFKAENVFQFNYPHTGAATVNEILVNATTNGVYSLYGNDENDFVQKTASENLNVIANSLVSNKNVGYMYVYNDGVYMTQGVGAIKVSHEIDGLYSDFTSSYNASIQENRYYMLEYDRDVAGNTTTNQSLIYDTTLQGFYNNYQVYVGSTDTYQDAIWESKDIDFGDESMRKGMPRMEFEYIGDVTVTLTKDGTETFSRRFTQTTNAREVKWIWCDDTKFNLLTVKFTLHSSTSYVYKWRPLMVVM